jgi:hypothetical protein
VRRRSERGRGRNTRVGRTRQVAPLRSTRNWRLWHVAWIGSLWVRKGTRTHQAGTDGLLIEHLFVRGRGDERRRLRLRLQPRERARHLRHLNLHKARTVVTVVTVVVRRQRAQPCTGSGSTVAATPSSARCLLLRRGGSTRHSGGRAGRWRGHRSETTAWSTASSHDANARTYSSTVWVFNLRLARVHTTCLSWPLCCAVAQGCGRRSACWVVRGGCFPQREVRAPGAKD